MRKLLDDLQNEITDFVSQSNDFAWLMPCGDLEVAYLLKSIESLERSDSPHLFWSFTHPFSHPDSFVRTIFEQFHVRLNAIREAQINEGLTQWPELPSSLQSPSVRPSTQLKALMEFARNLTPDDPSIRTVFSLVPSEVVEGNLWKAFVREMLVYQMPVPWCRRLRLILRENKDQTPLLSHQPPRRVKSYFTDLSTEAFVKSLEQQVASESTPLPVRMQGLLVLAGMDDSHRRDVAALQKYQLLLEYYEASEDKTLQALALNGLGQVCLRTGHDERAFQYFTQALSRGMEAQAKPVVLNVMLNLGNMALERQQWNDADKAYETAGQLTQALGYPTVKVMCLRNQGDCRQRQGDTNGAWQQWFAAAQLARGLQDTEQLLPLLLRLQKLYRDIGLRPQLLEVERELQHLQHSSQSQGGCS